jgi:hypothetical protein
LVLVCTNFFLWGIGLISWFSPTSSKTPFLTALLIFIAFFLIWTWLFWSGIKSKISADAEGIYQTNGFWRQNARWAEVAAYYWIGNARQREPVLLSADGTVLLRGFPKFAGDQSAWRDKYKAMGDFIAAHLEGKEIESPFLRAAFWVPIGPDVDPSRQSLAWKIMYGLSWLGYIALWAFLFERLAYYHFVVKTGPISSWINRWIFSPGAYQNFSLLLILGCFLLPLYLLVFWQRRRLHRHILPFRFVTPTVPPESHPLQ